MNIYICLDTGLQPLSHVWGTPRGAASLHRESATVSYKNAIFPNFSKTIIDEPQHCSPKR